MASISQVYGVVYFIHNTISNRVYVGKSVDYKGRWRGHLSDLRYNEHINRHLQAAWNKYGESAFEFVVIEEAESEEALNELECFYMEYLRFCGAQLYNMVEGGKGGFSPEARETARLLSVGRVKTEQEKSRWRASMAEVHASDAYRQNMRDKLIGRKKAKYTVTDTLRAKWEAQRGKTEAPEQTGKRIASMVANQPIKYFQSPSGDVYETRNVAAFARQHGLHPRLLSYVSEGKQSHHRGWIRVERKGGLECEF